MPPGPTTVDQTWLNFVGLEPDSAGYWIAVILAEVGGGAGVVICTGVLAAVFVFLRRLRAAGVLVTTMLTGIALSQLLKAVVIRLRPSEQLYDSLGYSYPSGHSMAAAALASALAFIASRAHVLKLAEAAPHLHRSSSDRDHSPAQTCPDAVPLVDDPGVRVDRADDVVTHRIAGALALRHDRRSPHRHLGRRPR